MTHLDSIRKPEQKKWKSFSDFIHAPIEEQKELYAWAARKANEEQRAVEKSSNSSPHRRTHPLTPTLSMKKIINDDFRNHLAMFEGGAFVVSDPPYNQGYNYNEYSDKLSIDEYGEMMRQAFGDKKSVIISYPEETINVLAKVLDNIEQLVAWVYNSNTAKQHRLITWWGCKPDMRRIGQAYKNPTDKRIAKRIADGKKAKLYDWWEINQVKNVSKKDNPHPCPIPYEVAERIILLTTNEGDTVIDPFAGSGTILLAAKNNNRQYIGFEIDKTYFDYMRSIGL